MLLLSNREHLGSWIWTLIIVSPGLLDMDHDTILSNREHIGSWIWTLLLVSHREHLDIWIWTLVLVTGTPRLLDMEHGTVH